MDPRARRKRGGGHGQARNLIVWHNHLPTCEQVSFSCERLAHGTQPSERR
jgi:hypothetical protein